MWPGLKQVAARTVAFMKRYVALERHLRFTSLSRMSTISVTCHACTRRTIRFIIEVMLVRSFVYILSDAISAPFVTLHWLPLVILLQSDGCTFVSCIHSAPAYFFIPEVSSHLDISFPLFRPIEIGSRP